MSHRLIFFGVAAVLLGTGCVHRNSERHPAVYAENGDIVVGYADEATMYDLDTAAQNLMRQMRESDVFKRAYAEFAKGKTTKPTLKIGVIGSRVNIDVQYRLDSIRNIVSISMYESELFNVHDTQVASGDIREDAVITGDLRRFIDNGGYYVYRLHFCLCERVTGKVMWEGAETVVKRD